MFYYIYKEWKNNLMSVILTIAYIAMQIASSLLIMQALQSIIDWDLNRFLVINLLDIGCWLLSLLFWGIENYFEFRAVRNMNNAVRRDIAASMAVKEYEEFHQLNIGEYISRFSNDIEQIEKLAWNSFYGCIEFVSSIVLSITALVSVHWMPRKEENTL